MFLYNRPQKVLPDFFKQLLLTSGIPSKGWNVQCGMKCPEVRRFFVDMSIKWSFILPKAPWWGGVFDGDSSSLPEGNLLLCKTIHFEEVLTIVAAVIEIILTSHPKSNVSTEDLK